MTWLTAMILVAAVVAIATLFSVQPRGGRNVGGTRLMAVGRVVLAIGIVIGAWMMLR